MNFPFSRICDSTEVCQSRELVEEVSGLYSMYVSSRSTDTDFIRKRPK